MPRSPPPRVVKAYMAMRELGIPDKRTKTVLKRLLKTSDSNWELIELDNYSVLVDAIFNSDEPEPEVAEPMKKRDDTEQMKVVMEDETQFPEEPEIPLKRMRVRHQDDQSSSSCINQDANSSSVVLKVPKSEVNELPESQVQPEHQSPAGNTETERVLRTDPQPVSPLKRVRNNGKQTEVNELPESQIQPEHQSPAGITVTERVLRTDPQPVSPLKRVRNNGKQADIPIMLIKPKDEPLINQPLTDEPVRNTSTENNMVNEPDPTKTMNLSNRLHETSNGTNGSTVKLDLASSSSGEIKITLRCISDKVNPNVSFKSEDLVLKTMEDMCLKSYKFLDANFSLKNMMTDMCECVLNLRSDHSNGFQPTASMKKTENENTHLVDDTIDISKGQESLAISLVNEVNTECPPSFHYIPKNAVFQNAYVNFSLALITNENCCSTCLGNCLTSSTPCPCALQNGGDFAYTNEGTIKEDLIDDCIQANRDPQKCQLSYCKECPLEKPKNEGDLGTCKGHSERGFIKECWLKCGCGKKCGNRVVQRGITHKLQVFMTPGGKGWGLRALEDLPKGAFVCEFVGEVLTCKEFFSRVSQSSKKDQYPCPVFLDAEWGEECEFKEDEALCLDATYYGNAARFINHRCFDANLIEIPVEVENPDRHYYHIALFTTRKVKALEELTRDYGIEFDDNDDPLKAFECLCGSRFCRDTKGSRKRKCADI